MKNYRTMTLFSLVLSLQVACGSDDGEGDGGTYERPGDGTEPGQDFTGSEPGGSESGDEPGGSGSGGSDPDGGDSGTGGSSALPTPGTSDAATCADQDDWDASWIALEDEVLTIVNEKRAEGASCGGEQFAPTHALVMDDALRCAARLHSKDMAEQDYFSHNSLDGRSPWDRMEAAGFESAAGGENIAAGHATATGTMEGWMDSPGHCSNIMSPDFDFIGVGYSPGGGYGHMWTQTFGAVDDGEWGEW